MKNKFLNLAIGVFTSVLCFAQPVPLSLNTGINSSLTNTVGAGLPVFNWQVSNTGINGSYVPAVRANHSGWTAGTQFADWITRDHGCATGGPAQHNCDSVYVDEHYRIQFQLPDDLCGRPIVDSNVYFLTMKYYADNCVFEIFVNGNSVYQNPNVLPWGSSNPYFYNSFNSPSIVTINKYWQSGLNSLVVHVKSEATPAAGGWSGFRADVDTKFTTDETPCDSTVVSTGCCLGNLCGDHQNKLSANYEIPLNSNNFYYTGDQPSTDKVNVGIPCSAMFPGKFNVTTNVVSTVGTAAGGGGNDSYSIYGTNTNQSPRSTNTGVYGNASTTNGEMGNNYERGVWGVAKGGEDGRGVFGQGNQATRSYGGYFESTMPNPIGVNHGIYAIATGGNLNWAGYFQGNVNINGGGGFALRVNGSSWQTGGPNWATSDRKFKRDIIPLEDVTTKLQKLNGYTYYYRTEEFKEINFVKEQQIGFIAQELKEVFPQLVTTDPNGALAVNYQGMIPVLVSAIKEQQQQINELKEMIAANSGGTSGKAVATAIPVNLSDKNVIVLDQNVPNPFAESTVIRYNLPAEFSKAQIIFTNNEGQVIKSINITEKGAGILNVFANDLTNGMYSYSLIVDGKTVDTKKMIKE